MNKSHANKETNIYCTVIGGHCSFNSSMQLPDWGYE